MIVKKCISFTIGFFLTTTVFADTCPPVELVKLNPFTQQYEAFSWSGVDEYPGSTKVIAFLEARGRAEKHDFFPKIFRLKECKYLSNMHSVVRLQSHQYKAVAIESIGNWFWDNQHQNIYCDRGDVKLCGFHKQ